MAKVGNTPSTTQTRSKTAAVANHTTSTDSGTLPTSIHLPSVNGELTPSLPISPSPAPTKRNKTSSSKVNQFLDLTTPNPSSPSYTNGTNLSVTHHMMTTPNQGHQPNPTGQRITGSDATTTKANNPLPLFNQIMEVTSLQHQSRPRRSQQQDPLEKYTRGIMTTIHDAHPGSEYVGIEQKVINEWRDYNGEKLLAIPFENDTRLPHLHYKICNWIFSAIEEIMQSKGFGIASPVPNDKNQNQDQNQPPHQHKTHHQDQDQDQDHDSRCFPTTFLVYNLSKTHYNILTQQTVWASQSITF